MKFKLKSYKKEEKDKKDKIPEVCREVYRHPCLCGSGELFVEVCKPDTPYPKTKRYQGTFTCEPCKEKYSIEEQGTSIIVVEISEIENRKKALEEWHHRDEDLMKSTKVTELLAHFKHYLSDFNSVFELGHALQARGLLHENDQTFEKEFEDAEKWIKKHIRSSNLLKVVEEMEYPLEEYQADMEALEAVWKEAKAPLTGVGHPLFKKRVY